MTKIDDNSLIHKLNPNYKLVEAPPSQADILNQKIEEFNAQYLSFIGDYKVEKNYIIKDADNNIIAGIRSFFILREYLHISALFVNEDQRKKGLGSLLLQLIEEEAKAMNLRLIYLETFDFQGKDFYLKHGYEIYGVIEDCPIGHSRYCMKKFL